MTLFHACSQPLKLVSSGVANQQIILRTDNRRWVIKDGVPRAPLLAVEETQCGDVELVFEQAEVSVTVTLVSL
jgi:hypothetical protein